MNVAIVACEWSIDIYGMNICAYDKVNVAWEWSIEDTSVVGRSSDIFDGMWSMIYRV